MDLMLTTSPVRLPVGFSLSLASRLTLLPVFPAAIDNATRRIVSVPQIVKDAQGVQIITQRVRRPVTVGLFFSLGHSTIVFATTVAIAISADVANHLDGFGDVGGIIGASVSGSFLILIGCINTVILYTTWRRLQRAKQTQEQGADAEAQGKPTTHSESHFNGLMTRVAMPILRSVDRPWKMYPVGILFGLGFDTASSIALLSVAAIAQQDADGRDRNDAKVVLLAFLFTAGMTLVDSADSCLMIWAYAPDVRRDGRKKFAIWEEDERSGHGDAAKRSSPHDAPLQMEADGKDRSACKEKREVAKEEGGKDIDQTPNDDDQVPTDNNTHALQSKDDVAVCVPQTDLEPADSIDVSASRMSLLLTLLSILVAFAIGLIVLMGLIGDECARCAAAADKQEQTGDAGLEGRWWLAWRKANDNSGYVGAGIVGAFALSVLVWVAWRWLLRVRARRSMDEAK